MISRPGKTNWTKPQNLHVTMNFIGDTPDDRLIEGAMVVPHDPRKETIPVREPPKHVADCRLEVGLGLDPGIPRSDDLLRKHDILLAEDPGRA